MSHEHYYDAHDLARFGEIGEARSELAEKFFGWYKAVFADGGSLTKREKTLIALGVAHVIQCPYCIHAYTKSGLDQGMTAEHLTEAVHVAAALRAGASLVHGIQMRNHVAEHKAEHK